MSVSGETSEPATGGGDPFDPATLVSRKPSALPAIYAYVVDRERATPLAIREALGVSKSVVHSNLETLRQVALVERPDRGVYAPATISLDPDTVQALGELRSRQQLEFCRFASRAVDLDVSDVADRTGMAPSNVRNAARRLEASGFISVHREPFEKSRTRYRLSEAGARALASVDVDRYLCRDGRRTVAHETGIEGTAFRTAYEVEDAHHLSETEAEWLHPERVASALEKDAKQTQRRFTKMADRGLLERTTERKKLVFNPTERTTTLFDELELYRISMRYGLDLYSVATDDAVPAGFSNDDLYSALVGNGEDVSVREIASARTALKRAGLLRGNPATGYSFTVGQR